jgi:hypothetical protein
MIFAPHEVLFIVKWLTGASIMSKKNGNPKI